MSHTYPFAKRRERCPGSQSCIIGRKREKKTKTKKTKGIPKITSQYRYKKKKIAKNSGPNASEPAWEGFQVWVFSGIGAYRSSLEANCSRDSYIHRYIYYNNSQSRCVTLVKRLYGPGPAVVTARARESVVTLSPRPLTIYLCLSLADWIFFFFLICLSNSRSAAALAATAASNSAEWKIFVFVFVVVFFFTWREREKDKKFLWFFFFQFQHSTLALSLSIKLVVVGYSFSEQGLPGGTLGWWRWPWRRVVAARSLSQMPS